MDRKGFIDEINPMFIGLALLGSIITVVMTKRVEGLGAFWKVLTPIVTFIAIYFYLAITDN